mmetsp:Transcript_22803/g.25382  ORF Transcript_22803/g.25382 Transcript_22803/m.25382 type:complete len:161 (+) Transcript_22803:32-514(+)|eukprot:CAMPEP_0168513306 /NCGR_PEP_ID=MMETSP0405-20121227/3368_1 /TAXON_ID=498012 /ORGANISM="Trichosphaerium sp, Strain Am-I-7 wt" /LENGTH=160 /DNA_ID=CAMNT_0008532081 /DNA_START=14 /DNA_END=496 /DNA_ORIENTATION=+
MSTQIKVGDTFPDVTVTLWKDKPTPAQTNDLFKGKKVVLFSIPGAFTPTCSNDHCPSFRLGAKDLKAKGVDLVCCTAVNDAFVLEAFRESQKITDEVTFLADGSAVLAKKLGLELDLVAMGLGVRGKRFAIIIDDLKVTHVAVSAKGMEGTSCDDILKVL